MSAAATDAKPQTLYAILFQKYMNYQHTCVFPENRKEKLWRYLTFEKFHDLIISSEIFLCRLDKFIDKYEGKTTEYTNTIIKNTFIEFSNSEEMRNQLNNILNNLKTHTFTSCWHLNTDENYEMWESYSNLEEGVLIKTTAEKLINSLIDENIGPIHLRPIKYGKRVLDDIDLSYPLELINFKDEVFKFENEYRLNLLYCKGEIEPNDENTVIVKAPEKGIKIRVKLNNLIEEIIVSPKSSEIFHEKISNLIVNKLNVKVKRSKFTI